MDTYIVLDEVIKVKNFVEGYKNWKDVNELKARMEDIFENKFAINQPVVVFTLGKSLEGKGIFKSVPAANMEEVNEIWRKRHLGNVQTFYYYVMKPDEELRVYSTYSRNDKKYWIVNSLKEFGYTEFRNFMDNEKSYNA